MSQKVIAEDRVRYPASFTRSGLNVNGSTSATLSQLGKIQGVCNETKNGDFCVYVDDRIDPVVWSSSANRRLFGFRYDP
jgi:hypothetical protein